MTGQSSVARPEPDRGRGRHELQERVIAAEVAEIIAQRLGIERSLVTLDAVLVDDLGASSLSIMELALAFEETFDIDVADHEVEQLCTVFEAVRCVWRALSPGGNEFDD
jgi:acyl carrier protein